MADKVWLTDTEVGTRFGSTRQWVWTQAKTNPRFMQPVKFTARWSQWSLQEIEADIRKQNREHEFRRIEIKQRIIEWVAGLLLFLICLAALIGLVLIMRSP